tara:strand:- start:555 stop:1103 length:549 start_codon:yes stop_codon:yes gene_type:complete
MLLDLRELRGSEVVVERSFSPAAIGDGVDSNWIVTSPVELKLRVRKDGDKYRLFGSIVTAVQRECCRCLKSFEVPMAMDIDLRYLPQVVNTGEGEYEICEDDLAAAFYQDDQIDLGDMTREQLQLASPMKPLCRDDCLGMCPICGADRNALGCECDTAWHDPRLDSLRTLLSKPTDEVTGKD